MQGNADSGLKPTFPANIQGVRRDITIKLIMTDMWLNFIPQPLDLQPLASNQYTTKQQIIAKCSYLLKN